MKTKTISAFSFQPSAFRTVALDNSNEPVPFAALENETTELDADGWALVAPFGRWPKTYSYQEGGVAKEKKFIQVLDNESADALVAKDNTFFNKLKRALVGVPIFKGHGDVKLVDPKAIANTATMEKIGVVDQIRKTVRGIEAHFALDNDGADAVKAGWKFPSGYWWVLPVGLENDCILARPFKLISVALTQFPNISGVESLANASQTEPAASGEAAHAAISNVENEKPNTIMKQLLIGWLAAQGIALANDSTDQTVFDSFNKEMLNRSTSITALGNEKTTLSSNVTTLTADRDAQKKRADESVMALANEQTARRLDRTKAAEFAVDLAITKGKLTVADRDTKIAGLNPSTPLANDAFDAAVKELFEAAAVVKTGADNVSDLKSAAALNNEADQVAADYKKALANELPKAGQNITEAHRRVMTLPEYSGLALKLAPKKIS